MWKVKIRPHSLHFSLVSRMALVVSAMLASFQLLARGQGKDLEMPRETASAPFDIKHQPSCGTSDFLSHDTDRWALHLL